MTGKSQIGRVDCSTASPQLHTAGAKSVVLGVLSGKYESVDEMLAIPAKPLNTVKTVMQWKAVEGVCAATSYLKVLWPPRRVKMLPPTPTFTQHI
jgi:hypothetical protein